MSNAPPPQGPPGPPGSPRDPKAEAAAAKAYAKAQRPWYKKKRWQVAILFAAIVVLVLLFGVGGDEEQKKDEAENAKDPEMSQSIEPTSPTTDASDEDSWTTSQKQAVQAAEDYLELTAMSKAGLIRQLSSDTGNGFSTADAKFAANHVDADWNAEAVEAAEGYMEMGGFSRKSLIQQLTSSSGDQFTQAQAEYAADKVGL